MIERVSMLELPAAGHTWPLFPLTFPLISTPQSGNARGQLSVENMTASLSHQDMVPPVWIV